MQMIGTITASAFPLKASDSCGSQRWRELWRCQQRSQRASSSHDKQPIQKFRLSSCILFTYSTTTNPVTNRHEQMISLTWTKQRESARKWRRNAECGSKACITKAYTPAPSAFGVSRSDEAEVR